MNVADIEDSQRERLLQDGPGDKECGNTSLENEVESIVSDTPWTD